jgi:hypothetical protein
VCVCDSVRCQHGECHPERVSISECWLVSLDCRLD